MGYRKAFFTVGGMRKHLHRHFKTFHLALRAKVPVVVEALVAEQRRDS